jgi:hypothetical protein
LELKITFRYEAHHARVIFWLEYLQSIKELRGSPPGGAGWRYLPGGSSVPKERLEKVPSSWRLMPPSTKLKRSRVWRWVVKEQRVQRALASITQDEVKQSLVLRQ